MLTVPMQFDGDRQSEVIQFILNHSDRPKIKGCPAVVLKTIDDYARTKNCDMNSNEHKSKIITDLISVNKPTVIVELGTQCGYSTILFSFAQQTTGVKNPKYYLLERSVKLAEDIKQLVELAGLEDMVEVVVGRSDENIYKLYVEGCLKHVDMLFLEQEQQCCLKSLEQLGMIEKGTFLIADNITKSNSSSYLDYVRSTVVEKRKKMSASREKDDSDMVFGRRMSQYGIGNPSLIYESRFIEIGNTAGVLVST